MADDDKHPSPDPSRDPSPTSTDRALSQDGTANAGASSSQPDRGPTYYPDDRDSPCVAVCSTLYDDVCRGGGRTVMEVANWVFFTEEERREVWARILSEGYPRRKS